MERYYKEGLKNYLIKKLDLKEYDFMFSENEMNFIPNDEESMSDAQKEGDLGLKFIFLRNELHLERIDEYDMESLEKEYRENRGELTEKAISIIESTYAKVISPIEILTEEDKNTLTCYDNWNSKEFVKMNTLVLKIGTMGEFDEEGDYIDLQHEDEKQEKLLEYAKNMELILEGRLGEIPIKIFVE